MKQTNLEEEWDEMEEEMTASHQEHQAYSM